MVFLTPIFYWLIAFSLAIKTEQKKPRGKILIFAEVRAFQSWTFQQPEKTANLKLEIFSHGWWRHLGSFCKTGVFSRIYRYIQNNSKTVRFWHNIASINVFQSKNGRWIQKQGSRCLKMNTTSCMTSSIRNLGKFGYFYKRLNCVCKCIHLKGRMEPISM